MSSTHLKTVARAPLRSNLLSMEGLETRRLLSSVLGASTTFAALGATTVTNTGATIITGDVGVAPGTAITGFPPGVITGGSIHAGDAPATAAGADAAIGYRRLARLAATTNLTNQDSVASLLTPVSTSSTLPPPSMVHSPSTPRATLRPSSSSRSARPSPPPRARRSS